LQEIGAVGSDIVIAAPLGTVAIVSKECDAGIDICQLAKLGAQLQNALANLTLGQA
jgi:hypothetical protein